MVQILNEVRIGNRVWSMHGYPDHGPADGVKVSIPADTGGLIVRTEAPYGSSGPLLYVIRWDNGQTSKHYFKQLCGIGHYSTMPDVQRVLETATGTLDIVIGPQGGFRGATVDLVLQDGSPTRLELDKDQLQIWNYIKPLLDAASLAVRETKLAPIRPSRA